MGRLENEFDRAKGKAKEGLGRAAGDEDLEREGGRDRLRADASDAVETAKDKAADAVKNVGKAFGKD
ncbi:CsbD family protein [Nocardiopsis composta]|uniref:Uncharacterized protein YjbJ (UPF0337 family) n=1 Tax=Nocardiopsis composta TaxID=157465 RepID=A0A7W8QKH1_9ACTN|nr:CsbD family protein [Nocardiopsis composta]MBB5431166.1 uncharacterized protein YjbJ (UPF0337 family) [Nocardiopsis composta]